MSMFTFLDVAVVKQRAAATLQPHQSSKHRYQSASSGSRCCGTWSYTMFQKKWTDLISVVEKWTQALLFFFPSPPFTLVWPVKPAFHTRSVVHNKHFPTVLIASLYFSYISSGLRVNRRPGEEEKRSSSHVSCGEMENPKTYPTVCSSITAHINYNLCLIDHRSRIRCPRSPCGAARGAPTCSGIWLRSPSARLVTSAVCSLWRRRGDCCWFDVYSHFIYFKKHHNCNWWKNKSNFFF